MNAGENVRRLATVVGGMAMLAEGRANDPSAVQVTTSKGGSRPPAPTDSLAVEYVARLDRVVEDGLRDLDRAKRLGRPVSERIALGAVLLDRIERLLAAGERDLDEAKRGAEVKRRKDPLRDRRIAHPNNAGRSPEWVAFVEKCSVQHVRDVRKAGKLDADGFRVKARPITSRELPS